MSSEGKMTLLKLTVLASVVGLVAFVVQLAESQDLLPAPTLVFNNDVDQSAIKLYSRVPIVCTVPNRNPAEVYLSPAANVSAHLVSFNLQREGSVIFTLTASPDIETAFVCWYRETRTKAQSQLSEPVTIVISALFDPIVGLFPPVFPVGVKYTVQCETPQTGYINTTISVYSRVLPLRLGNESFEYFGSRVLTPEEYGAAITISNARETFEFICEMEVFFNGRTLRSRTKPITAMPEELPVRLVYKNSDSRTCHGDAFLKVRDDWRPLCFASSLSNTADVARIICQELGCGLALINDRLVSKSPNAVGMPNCTGNEKKIAGCPLISAGSCDQGTLNLICSAALPPPVLSVSDRDTASRIYVRSEESLTLQCVFNSSLNERVYLTFTHNGDELYSTLTRSGYKETRTLYNPVPDGEYACHIHVHESKDYWRANSNVIGIYIYNPPPAGAVAGGVITTIIGVIIFVLLCIYGASE